MIHDKHCGRLLKACLAIILTAAIAAGCGEQPEITVGVEDGFQPFGYEQRGRYKGFEIDLWKAVATEAGMKFKLKPMAPGEMIDALEHRKIDAGIAGLSIKRNRKQRVEYSVPYFSSGLALVVRSDENSIKAPEDLKGKVVATKLGTTAYEYAVEIAGVREVRAYPDIAQAYEALIAKEADAVIFDEQNALFYVKNGTKMLAKNDGRRHQGNQTQVKTVGKILTKEQYAIALQTGSPYKGRINNALREIGQNGTYERLYKKWFGTLPDSKPGDK